MVTTIVVFFTLTFYEYKNQVIGQAEASVPKKPNFEHDNNQQFIKNVKQCVEYVYFYDNVNLLVNL